MVQRRYLTLCVAAASLSTASVFVQAAGEEIHHSDKVTIVGQESEVALSPLEQAPKVSKLGVPLEELPYSVAIIDQSFMQDTGAKNIQDALLYTSGIYAGAFGIDTRIDSAQVRGVSPLQYLDGLRALYGSYNNVRPSAYALEQVEVLKGPSSVLYGQGSVGGIVNSVTKRPQAETQGEIWAQAGSFGRKQLAADWTGALDDEGRFLFRMVGLARKSGTQVDHVDDDELLINPSLTWLISDATKLTLMANYQKNEGGITAQFLPTQGTLIEGPKGFLDPSTYIGEPGWDKYDREQSALTAEIDHRFNDQWSFFAVARYVDAETSTREHWANIGVAPDADGNIGRTYYAIEKSTQGLNWDARLKGDLNWGPTRHQLIIGVDQQDIEIDEWGRFSGAGTTINAYDPVYGSEPTLVGSGTDNPSVTTEQLGLYVADHINWGPVVLTAALRHDNVKTTQQGSPAAESSALTGQAGLMYQFESGFSPYISYSESFQANTGSDGLGGILEPTEGEQVEYGIKYLSDDGNTAVTLAQFDIEQLNRVTNGLTPGGLQQVGATIDGWELEVRRKWGRLSTLVNLSGINAKDGDGGPLPYVAEKQASLWSTYNLSDHWRVGVGVRRVGSNVGWGGAPEVSGVTLYDAMVGFETGDWEFTADVKNLTDETYVSWCRSNGTDCGFGEKLNATLNARYKF
ncbi:TonB-dependent siderophore receptor [Neptuniibacter halophilus]|uniref:TonB-dependent siderophore receptor n=1 Tax=Neptuniibacter halophilus TaxID=651666 RepID=UPI002573F56C|nr:TonB-dependent siderophore receptor [Neptuniibacter halophilus]